MDDLSVFTDKHLWTLENLDHLPQHFVENPEQGEGSLYTKLEQSAGANPPEVKQLAAEMLWLLFIIVYHDAMKAGTKRLQIRR